MLDSTTSITVLLKRRQRNTLTATTNTTSFLNDMQELYIGFEQDSRVELDRQLTIEYVSSPAYQGLLDAREGAEPNPEFIHDREYWIAYCKELHFKYCKKYEALPKSQFFTAAMEDEIMF